MFNDTISHNYGTIIINYHSGDPAKTTTEDVLSCNIRDYHLLSFMRFMLCNILFYDTFESTNSNVLKF